MNGSRATLQKVGYHSTQHNFTHSTFNNFTKPQKIYPSIAIENLFTNWYAHRA